MNYIERINDIGVMQLLANPNKYSAISADFKEGRYEVIFEEWDFSYNAYIITNGQKYRIAITHAKHMSFSFNLPAKDIASVYRNYLNMKQVMNDDDAKKYCNANIDDLIKYHKEKIRTSFHLKGQYDIQKHYVQLNSVNIRKDGELTCYLSIDLTKEG